MTQKEVIKLILILHGYDKDIDIQTERCDDPCAPFFEVHATNHNGDEIFVDEYGLFMTLQNMFEQLYPDNYNQQYMDTIYIDGYVKDILDDEWRKQQQDKREADRLAHDKWREENREYIEYCTNNHPCPKCEQRRMQCDFNSCDKMKKFLEVVGKIKA